MSDAVRPGWVPYYSKGVAGGQRAPKIAAGPQHFCAAEQHFCASNRAIRSRPLRAADQHFCAAPKIPPKQTIKF